MSTTNRKALAVSKDRSALVVLRTALQTLGYEPDWVAAGTDAVRKLGEGRYDVVVATFGSPPMTGYGLWALMQGTPKLAAVPYVLALTPVEQQRLLSEGREMPASLLIPFTAEGLKGAIDRAISGETVEVFEI